MSLWFEGLLLFSLLVANRLTFIYVFNRRLHLSFSKNPSWTFLYFLSATILVALFFSEYVTQLFASHSVIAFVSCLFVLAVFNPWVYDQLTDLRKRPKALAKANPDQQFLLIEDKYLLSKTGDVIFQQVAAGVLILLMIKGGVPFETLVPWFAGIFFLSHLHMFLSTRVIWALYFSVFATLAGFVLPYLILYVDGGIYYAIAIHTLWYVGSGAFFGFLENDTGLKQRN